jgi:peptidoglycan-associated lipoprotein
MRKIQLLTVLLTALFLSACSPRVASPPLLEELEPPTEDELTSDLGPRDFLDASGEDTITFGDFEGDEPVESRPTGEWRSEPALETVYFAHNKYDIAERARRTLLENADFLKRNPGLSVLVEGHCDERGTEQFNQALGENRSLAIREYMIQLGIRSSRVKVVTYGELVPAVEGHNEAAWRYNRRAEFKVAG